MPYYATGQDRDSYISGVRPCGKYGGLHDVNQRRDNLPDNVFGYIRDGVLREERLRLTELEARSRTRTEMIIGNGGKKMAGGAAGDERKAVQALEERAQIEARHEALLALYTAERASWDAQLAAKGQVVMK